MRTRGTPAMLKSAGNVLRTFVKYNAYIGYCQGMSFVVSFLLQLGFHEDQAFSVLKHLSNDLVPLDYYTNMLSVFSDKLIIIQLLKYFNKQLYLKIRSLDSDLGSLLFPVLLCLFTQNENNREIAAVLWDYLFVDGFVVIYKACLVLFTLVENQIMAGRDFAQVITQVDKKIASLRDPEPFRKGMRVISINVKILELCRIGLNDKEQRNLLEPLIRNQKPKTIKNCQDIYHVCLQHLQNEKAKCNTGVAFVYSRKPKINFIKNYCDNVETKYFFNNSRKHKDEDYLMLVRSDHICCCEEEREFDQESFRVNIMKKQTRSIMIDQEGTTTITNRAVISQTRTHANMQPLTIGQCGPQQAPTIVSPRTGRVLPHFKQPTTNMIRNKSLLKSESIAFIDRLMTENQSFSNLLDLCQQPAEQEEDSVSDIDTGTTANSVQPRPAKRH